MSSLLQQSRELVSGRPAKSERVSKLSMSKLLLEFSWLSSAAAASAFDVVELAAAAWSSMTGPLSVVGVLVALVELAAALLVLHLAEAAASISIMAAVVPAAIVDAVMQRSESCRACCCWYSELHDADPFSGWSTGVTDGNLERSACKLDIDGSSCPKPGIFWEPRELLIKALSGGDDRDSGCTTVVLMSSRKLRDMSKA